MDVACAADLLTGIEDIDLDAVVVRLGRLHQLEQGRKVVVRLPRRVQDELLDHAEGVLAGLGDRHHAVKDARPPERPETLGVGAVVRDEEGDALHQQHVAFVRIVVRRVGLGFGVHVGRGGVAVVQVDVNLTRVRERLGPKKRGE